MILKAPNLAEEKKLWQKGLSSVAGLDEVGRGSWAGPVVVGAAILPKNFRVPKDFADSKQLKPRKREKLAALIKNEAVSYCVSEVSVSIINRLGIGKATQMAFRKALKNLDPKADFVLMDAFYIRHFNRQNQKPIKKGDQKCASIAAASILAKVYRDSLMKKLGKIYPVYGFGKHKGYGTKKHQEAIKKYGFSRIHRRSFDLTFLHKTIN